MKKKRIGILTSGGDAPGMNAVIRAATRACISYGMEVKGIIRGYDGLLKKEFTDLDIRSVSEIINRGGTMIHTSRSKEFATEKGVEKAVENCRDMGLDSLIVIGGDGSFRGACELSKRGIQCIGIPGTIDNDIPATDYTIGFDTAMNTAVEMVDKIRDTMTSHDRCSVIKVMGRECGNLAVGVGIATGATGIIIPEIKFDFEKDVIERIEFTKSTGKKHFIFIAAEGAEGVDNLHKRIEECTGINSIECVLGYVQRGGSPCAKDRITGSEMGESAARILKDNHKDSKMIIYKNGAVEDIDLKTGIEIKSKFDNKLYNLSYIISI